MPEIRHYTVTETREVEVTANSSLDAAQIAAQAFKFGPNATAEGVWGHPTSDIKQKSLLIERQR